jgi:uncharacterized protein YbjT (DUF2867 family)
VVTVVTGATGWIGRHVVEELVSRGEPVRAVSRDSAVTPVLTNAELHSGDLRQPSTLRPALESATSLVLIAVPDTAAEVLALARESGIEHVVVISSAAVTAGYDTTYNLPVELAAQASGLDCTIVRPGEFATNAVLIWGPSIRKRRRVIEPYPEQEGNPIHERDVSDAVVAALVDPAQRGLVHTIVGPDTLTKRQQVALIAAAINAEIVVEAVSPARARDFYRRQGGFAAANADFLFGFENYDGESGEIDEPHETAIVSDGAFLTLAEVTGRPARSYAEWAQDHIADFAASPS